MCAIEQLMAKDNSMLAAILYGKEHLQLERIPVPAIGPGDILVRVRAALTCDKYATRDAS